MLARLHIIISSEIDKDIEIIKKQLLDISSKFSISPVREYQGLKGHSELYCTIDIQENEVQAVLNKLNNDWEGQMTDCICYGFNTKMFNELIYCLEFMLFV